MLLPEPGIFKEDTKYLFIGQNPGYPKPEIISTDAILLKKETTDNDFHEAYEKSQKSWKFWDFIKSIIDEKDLDRVSIINTCRCPTTNNEKPTDKMVENCKRFLVESIPLIDPVYIIIMGSFAKQQLQNFNLSKHRLIYSHHYSYLARDRNMLEKETNRLKKELA